MLTEEQIKNLKEGDKLLAEISFERITASNDIYGHFPFFNPKGIITYDSGFFHPSCLSLPPTPPKHDPNRLFKKGDKVRVVEWNGRTFFDRDHQRDLTTGAICVVEEDEADTIAESIRIKEYIHVKVVLDEMIRYVPACYLELITPVEELEPYFVLDSPRTFNICKRGGSKFAATYYKDQPLAREHAEKYCAALNAEYRKEQQ